LDGLAVIVILEEEASNKDRSDLDSCEEDDDMSGEALFLRVAIIAHPLLQAKADCLGEVEQNVAYCIRQVLIEQSHVTFVKGIGRSKPVSDLVDVGEEPDYQEGRDYKDY